jgi:hypothetical protein
MSREKDPECRGFLEDETPNAIRVGHAESGQSWWIPRSQIGYMRKEPVAAGTQVIFTLPEWLIEKKQCWELVP